MDKKTNQANQASVEEDSLIINQNEEIPDATLQLSVNETTLNINQEPLETPMYSGVKNNTLIFTHEEEDLMSKLVWDQTGHREFESGVRNVVLFPMGENGYEKGVAWNGVTAINENPGGADKTELYADDIKYAVLRAAETFAFTIEAYTYPDEWNDCDGSTEVASGVFLGQQPRKAFGLVYRTAIGDDQHPGMDKGYKLHIIYNATASPSSRGYTTINDNPDAISFSWEADSTPVNCTGYKAVSSITIDSTKVNATELKALEVKLFGQNADSEHGIADSDPELPSPDDVLDGFTA